MIIFPSAPPPYHLTIIHSIQNKQLNDQTKNKKVERDLGHGISNLTFIIYHRHIYPFHSTNQKWVNCIIMTVERRILTTEFQTWPLSFIIAM